MTENDTALLPQVLQQIEGMNGKFPAQVNIAYRAAQTNADLERLPRGIAELVYQCRAIQAGTSIYSEAPLVDENLVKGCLTLASKAPIFLGVYAKDDRPCESPFGIEP